MPALPEGEPAPTDGALPAASAARVGQAPFGVYVHVPYCATRCGYCDFNTYTPRELTAQGTTLGPASYVDVVLRELQLAGKVLTAQRPAPPPAQTVFVGGGTPTLLESADLARLVRGIRDELGLAPDAEVTTEANPDSVDLPKLAQLREAGFTRISLGMQSAREHVLATLDRTHEPGRATKAVAWARQAGFEHVNLDLIYGTPGETDDDWRASLQAAIEAGPDHVSAYALVVEPGTRLAAQVHRGLLTAPDDDVLADRYLLADEMLTAAGLRWYEVSNWAAGPQARAQHNLGYWTGGDWWGLGPGAHSHVAGTRWWNVKHPAAYAARLSAECSPAAAREVLNVVDQHVEAVMLGVRLAEGLPAQLLDVKERATASRLCVDGLADPGEWRGGQGRLVLTLRGRLLADLVVRRLLWEADASLT